MLESLRSRLLLWYTAILAVVVLSFAVAGGYLAWRSRLAAVDAALVLRVDALAQALRPVAPGAFDLDLSPSATEDRDYAIWTTDGQLIDSSDPNLTVPVPERAGARTRAGRREVARLVPAGAWVLVGQSLSADYAEMLALAGAFAVAGGAALALSLAGGWWWVGRALEPIDRISRTARAMTQGDFAARIPVARVETELGQVASALNDAFDRLQASIDRERRFAADASHELRTPLTTISTETQWALGRTREPNEYQQSLETCRRASERMRGIVEHLLALARAEAGADMDQVVTVRLDAVIAEVVLDVARLAEQRGIRLDTTLGAVSVEGDPDRLHEAVANVVANAVLYNQPGGRVEVLLASREGQAELTVRDTGIGIAPADQSRIFDPFVRVDPARGREAGGAGLGLAVTRAILRRHGGDIACESEPGRGTTMTLRLPQSGRLRGGEVATRVD
jgi:signal transduction histidine kinase